MSTFIAFADTKIQLFSRKYLPRIKTNYENPSGPEKKELEDNMARVKKLRELRELRELRKLKA